MISALAQPTYDWLLDDTLNAWQIGSAIMASTAGSVTSTVLMAGPHVQS